ncbi:MAG: DegT/DnrJ/EryC1/StrS family aminotransferase [Candidatus Zixiibacteriota bacterium]|nr:MAG: DegT/DnrJ/EryC1/StrS family aminotransferase [candidate division Zixibacteria bacterium]
MGVPLLDLKRQYEYLKPEMDEAVLKVLEHGRFILGPEVRQLEQQLAELCAVRHGVGVASGTDALLLALRAAGVQPGDEVITTDFSFFATAGVVARMGARPVFVDIEPDSYNIDPALIEKAVTPKTRAVIPVHLFGQVADMDPITEICRRHSVAVIEDAAQAIGAGYKGRPAGSIADYGCFSFYPSKNLGAGGDGGLIVTDSDDNAELLQILRVHGARPKYFHRIVGYNSRLATVQAAILLVKLRYLRQWSEKRIQHAGIYDDAFKDNSAITRPVVKDYTTFHIYNQYTIAVENRDEVIGKLREAGIGYEIYYPVPFHKQECFAYLGYRPEEFPNSNRAAETVLSLPIYPELTSEEQGLVIETVTSATA